MSVLKTAYDSLPKMTPLFLSLQFSFTFLTPKAFCIGVKQINNVDVVSGEQQSDSTIHIHVSILPQDPLPSGLPYNIEQSSMCYTTGPCWISILNVPVCT